MTPRPFRLGPLSLDEAVQIITPPTPPRTSPRCDGGIGYPCNADPSGSLSRIFETADGREVTSDPHPVCRECLDELLSETLPNPDTRTVGYVIRGLSA